MALQATSDIILAAGLTNQNKQASFSSSSTTGTISVATTNVTFYNVGAVAVTLTVNGNAVSVPAVTTISFNAGDSDNKYPAGMFSWTATGGTLLIGYTY